MSKSDETVDTHRADALHADATVVLSYMNPAMRYPPDGRGDHSVFFQEDSRIQGAFHKLRQGAVDVIAPSFGVNNRDLFTGKLAVGRQFQLLSNFLSEVEKHDDAIALARTVEDVRRINDEQRMAVLLHLTGVELDGDLSTLYGLHALGVRAIHPPFDSRSPGADAVNGGEGSGLTDFGREVVREMERLGMVVDVSHCSDTSFWQLVEPTEKPVVASHSNCRALADVKRNLTDEQIKAIAEKGGVIGVHFASGFIEAGWQERFAATGFYEKLKVWQDSLRERYPDPYEFLSHRFNWDTWEKSELHGFQKQTPTPPLSKLVDHIDRIVDIAGLDHVGVGSDYDLGTIPSEVDSAEKLPALTRALLERGYSDDDVKKVWGGNFLRVYEAVLGS